LSVPAREETEAALRQERMHELSPQDSPMLDERELGALLRLLTAPPRAWLEAAAAVPHRLRGLEPPAAPPPTGSEESATLAERTR
jgi:hypothetical protein